MCTCLRACMHTHAHLSIQICDFPHPQWYSPGNYFYHLILLMHKVSLVNCAMQECYLGNAEEHHTLPFKTHRHTLTENMLQTNVIIKQLYQ